MTDILRLDTAGTQCRFDGPDLSGALGIGRGDVIGVGAGANAGQPGVNPSATSSRVLGPLQHNDASTLTEHKAVAVDIQWTRSAFWFVIAGAHGACLAEVG